MARITLSTYFCSVSRMDCYFGEMVFQKNGLRESEQQPTVPCTTLPAGAQTSTGQILIRQSLMRSWYYPSDYIGHNVE
ncbi:602_t:CDS:2, partial [Ambispora leptoticha]